MSNLNNNTTQLEALLAKVNALPEAGSGGTDTSDATATADEIFAGETAYNADGKVTGTFTIESELSEQNTLISQIATLVSTKANPQGGTDTSDATATAGDILTGKTAYVNGEKITGILSPIETCTVTFESTNSSYTQILFIQYATVDELGKVVGKTLTRSSITSSFSIQCVCNTCIAGIFPPTNISGVSLSSNITQNLSANSSNGAFFWGTLTALPNETVTITFS